jgi:hypothetical protein
VEDKDKKEIIRRQRKRIKQIQDYKLSKKGKKNW